MAARGLGGSRFRESGSGTLHLGSVRGQLGVGLVMITIGLSIVSRVFGLLGFRVIGVGVEAWG